MTTNAHEEVIDLGLLGKLLKQLEESTVGQLIARLDPRIINELRELMRFMHRREPRIMVLGRRGAGKSSLINAMLGVKARNVGSVTVGSLDCKWEDVGPEGKRLRVLDTKGTGQGDEISGEATSALEMIKTEIKRECPDVLLWVSKAKEVDADIQHDLAFLNRVVQFTRGTYAVDSCPVLAVVNQVDELDPAHVTTPPFDDPVKQENIRHAVQHLGEMFKLHYQYYQNDRIIIRPICSYMYFQNEQLACDRRWQIDDLLNEILAILPDEAILSLMKLGRFQDVRRRLANRIVNTFTMATGIIGAEPIPYADLPILTSLQVSMIGMIQAVAGRGADMRSIRDFLAATGINVTGAFTMRELVRALVKLLPGAGSLISGTVAAGYTKLIGTTAINHFIEGDEIGKATARAEQATGKAWAYAASA